MDVLTFETCWAANSEIIKQVTSSWSIFIQLISLLDNSVSYHASWYLSKRKHKTDKSQILDGRCTYIYRIWNHSFEYKKRITMCTLGDLFYVNSLANRKAVLQKKRIYMSLVIPSSAGFTTNMRQLRGATDNLVRDKPQTSTNQHMYTHFFYSTFTSGCKRK